MPKRPSKVTSIRIENNLYLLSVSKGLDMSAFVNRCLALLFDVPEDPFDKLIRERSEYFVLQLKENYNREVRELLKEQSSKSLINDAIKDKENDIVQFGELLKKTTSFKIFKNCLSKQDFDEDIVWTVTSEINKMNGRKYETNELWNKAIDWYRHYGKVPA